MKKIVLALSVAAALGSTAFAGKNVVPVETPVAPVLTPWYAGLAYSNLKMDLDCNHYYMPDHMRLYGFSDDDRSNGIMLLGGYEFNEYLAVEARWTVALNDFEFSNNGNDMEIEYYNVALYLKPQYRMGDFSIYGLLGFGYSHFKGDDVDVDDGDSDFQYGAGLSYRVTERFTIFADYTVLYDEDDSEPFHRLQGQDLRECDVKVDSFNVGFTYRF
jgi:opacity protein-like surface antigen